MLHATDDTVLQQSLFTSGSDVYDPGHEYAGHHQLLDAAKYHAGSLFSQAICRYFVLSML